MPNIVDLFNPYRGDLVYGFAADRDACFKHMKTAAPPGKALSRFFETQEDDDICWLTVDKYNDSIFGQLEQINKFEFATAEDKARNLASMSKTAEGNADADPRLADFWARLRDSRYSPLEVFNAPATKLAQEGWPDLVNDRYYLAIRRACKFGIQHVLNAASADAKIHFLLDRFHRNNGERMADAVFKAASTARGRTSLSITYSEIRHIYRHWDEVKDRIVFYYEFKSADAAPWEDTTRSASWISDEGYQLPPVTYKELWTFYGAARQDKYKNLYERARSLPKYATAYAANTIAITTLITAATGLADGPAKQEKYEAALKLLEPDKNNWKALKTD